MRASVDKFLGLPSGVECCLHQGPGGRACARAPVGTFLGLASGVERRLLEELGGRACVRKL